MDTKEHECGFSVGALRRGARSGFFQEDDPRQRNGSFALRQLFWVGGVPCNEVVSSKFIQRASTRREIQGDRSFTFKGCEMLASTGYFRNVSDPDFVARRIEFVAQAKGENFIATVEEKLSIVLALLVGCVCPHEVSERVIAPNCVVWHGGKMT